ncbi:MAG: hypothetical protein J6T99_02260 [Oscillospiraceae bacterium]|nr:hypothetical protein [Oscillospiraceae bacterium]MBO7422194.1 hypothetical protein [Oscillospiraceae bacterium]MBO7728938.1 hypothetical protein [Oscillospiraceae bacterium]MBP5169797.1 hypothetical protein [Oscillospiraceae bacterium]
MDDKEKQKKRIRNRILFLVLAGALTAAARPGIHFFEALIADGEPTATTSAAAAILCGLIAIVLLTTIAGILSLARWPVAGTAILIFLITTACGVTLYKSVQNMPPPAVTTPGTPRPTVTPPQVEIITMERENGNPETGSVFYRRYGNERGSLVVENGSRSDICFRMLDRHGLLVLIFYVRAGDSCTVPVPTGTYEFRCVTGGEWIDEETYFGDKTHYRRVLESYVFYDGQPEIMKLTEGLPEMKTIKKKDFEDTTVAFYS